jgi:hypothetical protein
MKTTDGVEIPKRRAGLYYEIPDKPIETGYPSVTTILRVLSKPELDYWKLGTVYDAVTADPTIDKARAIDAPNAVMRSAGKEGSRVHKLIDEYFGGTKYVKADESEKAQAYLTAFEEFYKMHRPKVVETEGMVYSHKREYAGTYDGLFEIAGEIWLLDWKTSNQIHDEARIQLCAYKHALEEMGKKVDRMAVVQLKNNGAFVFEEIAETEREVELFGVFMACLTIYNALKRRK